MNQQSPYEQIRFINDAIKDRQDKNQPTFFSIKLERMGALTPLATKEDGATFYDTVIKYLSKYTVSALIVELYSGKSHNVKNPFQTIKINLNRTADLGSVSVLPSEEEIKVTPAESIVTAEKHFFSLAEKERQLMLLEFENKRLQHELEQLQKKNKKRKRYILELEDELSKTEKDKKNSLGNVTLGLAGANAIESFAKSSFGMGILKTVFGMKEETLNGLLGDAKAPEPTATEPKSTATLIKTNTAGTEVPIPPAGQPTVRDGIKSQIVRFLDGVDEPTLNLYYELIQYLGTDTDTIKSVLGQIKAFREKQRAAIERSKRPASESPRDITTHEDDNPETDDSS